MLKTYILVTFVIIAICGSMIFESIRFIDEIIDRARLYKLRAAVYAAFVIFDIYILVIICVKGVLL